MNFLASQLGIDLGTTNTLVFRKGHGVVLNEPSLVAVSTRPSGAEILAVGAEAKEMVGKTPDDIIAYRPMRDGVIADYRVVEAMLSYYIEKALGRLNIFKPEVLVSVPAGVTSTERRAVVEATLQAGARHAYLVKEPILAAIGAGVPIQEAGGNMVVDIGGGTTDAAVISLGGIVSADSVKFAGNRIDQVIVDYVKRNHKLLIGENTAEQIKIKIGSAIAPTEELTTKVKGRNSSTGLPRAIELNSAEISRAIQGELNEIITAITTVLRDTPPELGSDIIDRGITMTGGTSQLRHLPELVLRKTGIKARLAEDPLHCVVKGTGVALNHLDTYKKSIIAKR